MSKLALDSDVQEALERAAHLRWVDHRDDPERINEIADERADLCSKLTAVFGPVIQQLLEAEILTVNLPSDDSTDGTIAANVSVLVHEEDGIILDCVGS
jgi:hypothetical protein